jgi:tetratricopeptide (TPR) repeat protein
MAGRGGCRFSPLLMSGLFALTLATGCQHATTGPSATDQFAAGRIAMKNNDYRGAIADFSGAIAGGYGIAPVYYDRAMSYYNMNQFAASEADYTTALQLVAHGDKTLLPTFVHAAHYYRGLIRVNESKWALAKADMLDAVRSYPKDWHSWDNLGYARLKLGDDRGAVPDFNRGLTYFPNDANDHFNRGLALYHLGKNAQAITDLTRAVQLSPRFGAAYQWRGLAYFALSNYQQADSNYTRAIQLIPKAWSWDYRCEARESLGHMKEALYDCNHAVAYYPQWSEAYVDRGWAKAMLGAGRGALADMNSAVKADPHNAAAYKWRGWVHERLSQYRAAFVDYAQALHLDHRYAAASQARIALGNWIAAAQRAGVTSFGLGSIDVAHEETEQAPPLSEYQKAVSLCGGYFDESDSYFDDCVDNGVDVAKNDEAGDEEAEQQAEADNYDVAQRVQQEIDYQQSQAEEAQAQQEQAEAAAQSEADSSGSQDTSSSGDETQPDSGYSSESEPAPEEPEVQEPEPEPESN